MRTILKMIIISCLNLIVTKSQNIFDSISIKIVFKIYYIDEIILKNK